MLKAEAINKLKSYGLDVDKLLAAAKAPGEVDLEIPEVTVFTAEALSQRDANIRKEGGGERFEEGKNAGMEIASKTIAKKFNLDPQLIDFKKPEKVAEAIDKMAAKGDDGLKEQVTLLQGEVEKLSTEKKTLEQKHQQAQFDTELISTFPQNRASILSDNEYLPIIKGILSFEEIEGKKIVKRNGEILRDPKTQNPLPIKDAINSVFAERKWVDNGSGGGGRGGQDKMPAGGVRTMSQLQEKYKKETGRDNFISAEFTNYVVKETKDVPDFDHYN